MSNTVHFTPGPSQLYPNVDQFLQEGFDKDVYSISHRSSAYKEIHQAAVEGLKELISLPDNYNIFFLGSATEAWERIIQNGATNKSFHFVNGSFSKKFFQYAQQSGIDAKAKEVASCEGFDSIATEDIDADTELVCFTHNETSTGVSTDFNDIYATRERFPEALIAVDVVSSLPYPEIDFSKIDSAFFSVQKCFGLPAGLGVWLVNDRFLEKAKQKKEAGILLNPHHNVFQLKKQADAFQTPSTPNVLNIFLLSKVIEAMNKKTSEVIRQETDTKAKMLYDFVASHDNFDFAVANPNHRSQTVVVAKSKKSATDLNKTLAPHNLAIGSGYGEFKASQIRIANFPAHSIEDTKRLIEILSNS